MHLKFLTEKRISSLPKIRHASVSLTTSQKAYLQSKDIHGCYQIDTR